MRCLAVVARDGTDDFVHFENLIFESIQGYFMYLVYIILQTLDVGIPIRQGRALVLEVVVIIYGDRLLPLVDLFDSDQLIF